MNKIEPFVVKHYGDDPHPTLKGNGFDGLTIGNYRDEAEAFAKWINERLAVPSATEPKRIDPQYIGASVSGAWVKEWQDRADQLERELANARQAICEQVDEIVDLRVKLRGRDCPPSSASGTPRTDALETAIVGCTGKYAGYPTSVSDEDVFDDVMKHARDLERKNERLAMMLQHVASAPSSTKQPIAWVAHKAGGKVVHFSVADGWTVEVVQAASTTSATGATQRTDAAWAGEPLEFGTVEHTRYCTSRDLERELDDATRDFNVPLIDADFDESMRAYADLDEAKYPVCTEKDGYSAFNDVVRSCIRMAKRYSRLETELAEERKKVEALAGSRENWIGRWAKFAEESVKAQGNPQNANTGGTVRESELEHELAEANERIASLKQGWDRLQIANPTVQASTEKQAVEAKWIEEELKDGDRICEAAGVQRTEGGRLPVAKIVNKLRAAPTDRMQRPQDNQADRNSSGSQPPEVPADAAAQQTTGGGDFSQSSERSDPPGDTNESPSTTPPLDPGGKRPGRIDEPCATCDDDPEVCATVPGLRHCEAANRSDPWKRG